MALSHRQNEYIDPSSHMLRAPTLAINTGAQHSGSRSDSRLASAGLIGTRNAFSRFTPLNSSLFFVLIRYRAEQELHSLTRPICPRKRKGFSSRLIPLGGTMCPRATLRQCSLNTRFVTNKG